MGLIYNTNTEETEIMAAYGITVYGNVSRYDWTLFNKETENALTSIRVVDNNGNDLVDIKLGNNCVLQSRIDDTMDNFIYWIAKENPDKYAIEDTIYNSLCTANSLFNHRIQNMKLKDKKREETERREKEREEKRKLDRKTLEDYCKEKGLFYYIGFDEVVLIKANTNSSRKMLAEAQRNSDFARIGFFVQWIEKYPDNKDLCVVNRGTMDELLKNIK